jgi:hypothetical protein
LANRTLGIFRENVAQKNQKSEAEGNSKQEKNLQVRKKLADFVEKIYWTEETVAARQGFISGD